MASRLVSRVSVYAIGTLGLLLVTLVGKLAPYATAGPQTGPEHIRTWLAQRGLDGIGAIGWLVDRLPPSVNRSGDESKLAGKPVKARTV
jgi:hypothetical protein